MRLCTLSGHEAKTSGHRAASSRHDVKARWLSSIGLRRIGPSGVAWLLLLGCSAGSGGADDLPVMVSLDEPPGSEEQPPPVSTTPPTVDTSPVVDLGGAEVDPPAPVPVGLTFTQPACSGGATTSISGTVYVPSGNMPLYNAMVYVPRLPLEPMPQGASCGCSVSGEPIVATITDADGRFVLENAPVGSDIPLVIQVGKWRREFNLGSVDSCTEHAVPETTLRLPSNQTQGDMPMIAVSTGAQDALECLLRKLGIEDSEFTNPELGGRVNLLEGYGGNDVYDESLGGDAFWRAERVWSDLERLKRYDVLLLSCEGDSNYTENKSEQAFQAMFDYANLGGRIFASHYHSLWFRQGPAPFPDIATFLGPGDDDDLGNVSADVVTAFPKGQALGQWLTNVEGTDAAGEVPIDGAQHAIDIENPDYAQRWIVTGGETPSVQYLSANTPLGAPEAEQCGRVVLSDIHVAGGLRVDSSTRPPILLSDVSTSEYPFPTGCVTNELTPQEKVLAFMLFDISACVIPDSQAPTFPSIR